METKFENYKEYFLSATSGKLKCGVGVHLFFHPFPDGVLIKIEMVKGSSNQAQQKKPSADIVEALINTRLFSYKQANQVKGRTISNTMYSIVNAWTYVVFKSLSSSEWTAMKAEEDFINIVNKVKEKYGKK